MKMYSLKERITARIKSSNVKSKTIHLQKHITMLRQRSAILVYKIMGQFILRFSSLCFNLERFSLQSLCYLFSEVYCHYEFATAIVVLFSTLYLMFVINFDLIHRLAFEMIYALLCNMHSTCCSFSVVLTSFSSSVFIKKIQS